MILTGKTSGIIQNFTMCVDHSCKNIEKFRGGNQWFMIENEDFLSSNIFIL